MTMGGPDLPALPFLLGAITHKGASLASWKGSLAVVASVVALAGLMGCGGSHGEAAPSSERSPDEASAPGAVRAGRQKPSRDFQSVPPKKSLSGKSKQQRVHSPARENSSPKPLEPNPDRESSSTDLSSSHGKNEQRTDPASPSSSGDAPPTDPNRPSAAGGGSDSHTDAHP
jgi:hypothetical protein